VAVLIRRQIASPCLSLVFLPVVQPLKHLEDPVEILLVKSAETDTSHHSPSITGPFSPVGPAASTGRRAQRRLARQVELERIADQVLQQLPHLRAIGSSVGSATSTRPQYANFQIDQYLPCDGIQVDRCNGSVRR
jgi:hypothetical protein